MKISNVFITRNLKNDIADNGDAMQRDVMTAFNAFKRHEWGDLCDFDEGMNDEYLKDGGMILGAYDTVLGEIWIIADAVPNPSDARHITILYPSEY